MTSKNPVWANVAKAYDFVGFDPRGVGHSAAISCMDPQEFVKAPKMDPVPDSEADKLAQRKLAREYAEGCLDRTGRAMLQQMTTPNTARDLDVIRAALGEKKINYLASPTAPTSRRLRHPVPGPHPPDDRRQRRQPGAGEHLVRGQPGPGRRFEGRWKDWQDWVAKNDATFHLGTTRDAVQAKWLQLRATAKKNPIGGVVGPAELLAFFQSAPYYDSAWVPVATVFSKYYAGDTQALVDAAAPNMSDTAGNISAENGNAVYTAVECTDAKWPTSWKKWDADNTRLNKKYPFLTWSNAWMNLPCATWPVKQQTPVNVKTGKGLPQVLIVQSTRDAATPYQAPSNCTSASSSRLITEKDAGSHGVTGLVNPCINNRVDAYLLTGKVDKADVTCAPHATPKP